MQRPFRWSLQWQILIAMLLVLLAGSWLYGIILDNLLITGFDRQLTDRLDLVARLGGPEAGAERLAGYLPGDESTRSYQADRTRFRTFAAEHALARVTLLSPSGAVLVDSDEGTPGTTLSPGTPALPAPARMVLHREHGRWRKTQAAPLPGGRVLRLEAGPESFVWLDRMRTRRWWALGLAASLALALSWVLARILTTRLSRLSAAFAHLQAGERHRPLPAAGSDEIAFLARRFNAMAGELEARTDRERRTQERRIGELQVLAGGVAHEIRNPLGAISGLADLLAREPALQSAPRAQDLLRRLRVEVERLDASVRAVLDYARQPELRRERVSSDDLLAEARDTDPACRVERPEGALPVLSADRDALLTILRNLLVNAREAAGPQGSVRLGLRVGRRRALFWVADDGPGVPPSAAGQIFRPFFSSKARGSGLGLAISRNLAAALGGALRLAPTTRGALFVLAVPVSMEVSDGSHPGR